MALRSTKAVGTIATIQLMSQMAPLDIRGTAESQSVIGRLGVFAPPSSRRSASGAVSGSVDCRALGGCSAGTSLRRSPRGVPKAGGSVRAGVEAAGGWTGHVGRRMTQVWRAPGDATLWTCVCRVAATAWTRAPAPRDGWWLASTCRTHAATSPDWLGLAPRRDSARRCVQARRLAALALGTRAGATPLAGPHRHMACMPTMWGDQGGQGGGAAGWWLETRGYGEHAAPGRCRRMHSQRFPPRFEGPSHGQYPPSMHMYQARTENPRPKGFEGCHTRTDRGDGICVGRDGALCKPQHAEVALEGSSPLSTPIRMPPPDHAARVAACQTPRPS